VQLRSKMVDVAAVLFVQHRLLGDRTIWTSNSPSNRRRRMVFAWMLDFNDCFVL
jgi:hypothetical protein